MTDHDFELRLRADLREAVEPASAALRSSVTAIPDEVPAPLGRRLTTGWRFPAMLRFAPLAIAAAAVVVIALVGIGLVGRPPDTGPPAVSPSAAAESVEPTPSAPAASATESEVVSDWPGHIENRPGLYSWDGSSCKGSCNIGFMHNASGHGSGDVTVTIEFGGLTSDGGGTAVTVAGHDGIYRRIDAQREEWVVDIEGTTITIQLSARRGTSQADLAEAHAIIDSMRTEPRDSDLGFRLVFTLTTNDWDSG